jgi:hypothetical protein
MADEHPLTVFAAENAQVADAVIRLLAGAGIAAEVYSPPPQTESSPLTGTVMSTPDELEIRVTNPAQLTQAKELMVSAVATAALRAIREKRASRTGTVTAVCEDCGKSSEWPAAAMGTTETCPHCTGYMDIPDPDENWDDMDFGEAEEEDGEGTEEEMK